MFRKKSQPIRIEAELSNDKGESHTKEIVLPIGSKVSRRTFSPDLIIKDSDGKTKQTIDFQAGFTIILNYFY